MGYLKENGIKIAVIVLVVLGISIFFAKKDKMSDSTTQISADFELTDLYGKPLKLADFRGKTVVLNFWATWCGPCVLEIPHLIEFQKKYKDKGYTVIGLSLDEGDAAPVKEFVKQKGMNYPVAIANETIAQAYGGIRGIPTTFVIDTDGKVVKKASGYHDLQQLEALIK